MEKKFFSHLKYLPCKLLSPPGKRWHVIFYQTNPATGKRERIQRSFGLNRISNKRIRKKEAQRIMDEINQQLPLGYPFIADREEEKIEKPKLLLGPALEYSTQFVKDRQRAKKSKQVVEGHMKRMLEFIRTKQWDGMRLSDFNTREARMYIRWITSEVERTTGSGISERTHNNHLTYARMFFHVLVDEEYITKNPFVKIPMLRVKEQTVRRRFLGSERTIIAKHIYEVDYWLFISIVIELTCYLRPNEIRRLRFRDFDLDRGLIEVRSDIHKNSRRRWVTIPSDVLKYFEDKRWSGWGDGWYIFGAGGKCPHPTTHIGRDTMSKRHRKIINKLARAGLIQDHKKLHYYSWKYTGITKALEDGIPLAVVSSQAGHTNVNQTMTYYRPDRIREHMRDSETGI